MNKAVFMDRDGVINKWEHGDKDVPESWYVLKWEDFEFLPGVKEAIGRLLNETDYHVIVVSNQSGIGRGYVEHGVVEDIFFRMKNEILVDNIQYIFNNAKLDYYFCPHTPEDNCACRKPSPGMIYKAAIEHEIDLSRSWMVGDSDTDMHAGYYAGIRPGGLLLIGDDECPVIKFSSLLEAVEFIIGNEAQKEAEKHGS